ncbi:uncharacterized protein LOC133923802 isoform X1 [Phragmites australis]|uniref:uncharacterized protein LOC133923802 isoform X1 n=1 Tax=Phragmites australis TaxID=29695 RepID=UPI002D79F03E|nr:uncharacterized protein LOC133923802 isoform X1 [Phragmites australis]
MGGCSSVAAVAVTAAFRGEGSAAAVMEVVSRVTKSLPVKRRDPIYILYPVDDKFRKDLAGSSEANPIMRNRVHEELSKSGRVNIRLFDLHKLHNFPGWRWKDVQKTLSSHKKTKVSILIYDEKKVALDALAAELELTHFYEMPHPSQPTT